MRRVIRIALASALSCGITWAGFISLGDTSLSCGATVYYQAKLEPPQPDLKSDSQSGHKRVIEKGESVGIQRFWADRDTHEYFGYQMVVQPINVHAGTYRVTFSPLTLTPLSMELPAGSWRMLPAPSFPPPQTVTTADTMAFDLFVNPASGQKIVDYIRVRPSSCDVGNATANQSSCLDGLRNELQDEEQNLAERLSHTEAKQDPGVIASIKESQQNWIKYRDSACGGLPTEVGRLKCELTLIRGRRRDIQQIY